MFYLFYFFSIICAKKKNWFKSKIKLTINVQIENKCSVSNYRKIAKLRIESNQIKKKNIQIKRWQEINSTFKLGLSASVVYKKTHTILQSATHEYHIISGISKAKIYTHAHWNERREQQQHYSFNIWN